MAVGSIGVGSGLPLEELLEDLRAAEEAPLALIEDKQTLAGARLSAYGVLKAGVEALQNAAKALGNPETYAAMRAASSFAGIGVSAGTTAIPGTYSVEVQSLASSQMLVAAGQADRTTAIGTGGVVKFMVGDTEKTLDLEGKGTSLNDIVAAINADPSLGVQATVVNDGQGNPHRLMLTATASGTDGAVTSITVEGNTELEGVLSFNSGSSAMTETAAKNAELTVNGIPVTSRTNTVTDVIEGVTLTLTELTTAPATITVSRNTATASSAINAFATAYNNLQRNITDLTAYDSENNSSGALTGDSAARTIQSRMREALYTTLPDGTVNSLSQLGITTNTTTGQLTLDNTKIDAALKDNLADVSRLFAGEDGVAKKITAASDTILRSNDGVLTSASNRMDRTIADLDNQEVSMKERIDATMERYRQQFIALDSMVAQMDSLSSYLTQQLSMLNNNRQQN